MENMLKFNKVNLLKILIYLIFYPIRTIALVLLLSIFGISRVSTPIGSSLSLLLALSVLSVLFNFFNSSKVSSLNIKPISLNKILFLIPFALLIRLPFLLIGFLPFITKDSHVIMQSLNQFSINSGNVDQLGNVLTVINVAFLGPILEELFFRGVIFNTLKSKYSVAASIIVSSLLFSLFHGNILLMTTSFIHGIVFAFIYHKYKNIAYSIALHSFSNLIPLLFALI